MEDAQTTSSTVAPEASQSQSQPQSQSQNQSQNQQSNQGQNVDTGQQTTSTQTAPSQQSHQQNQKILGQSQNQNQQNQQSQQTNNNQETPQDLDTPSWMNGFNDELRQNKTLRNYKSAEEVAKALIATKKFVGEKGIKIPDENTAPEEVSQFYSKLGWPSDVSEYKIDRSKELPQEVVSKEDITPYLQKFHELHLTQEQVQGVMSVYDDSIKSAIESEPELKQNAINNTISTLREEWGNNYEENVRLADMARNQLDPKGEIPNEYLEAMPGALKLLHRASKLISGDTKIGTPSNNTDGGIDQQIASILNNKNYWNKGNPESAILKERMKMLQQKKHAMMTG